MTFGQVGYEAYGKAHDWLTFDGRKMPAWNSLLETEAGEETRRCWEVAAQAVIDRFEVDRFTIHYTGPKDV